MGERLLRVLDLIVELEVDNLTDDVSIERKEAFAYDTADSVTPVCVNIVQDKSRLV